MARSTGRWASSSSPSDDVSQDLDGHVVDAVEIHDRSLGLEHPLYAALLQLHLRGADGERAERADAVVRLEVVVATDPFDADRFGRRVVDDDLESIDPLPAAASQHLDSRRPGGKYRDGARQRRVEFV